MKYATKFMAYISGYNVRTNGIYFHNVALTQIPILFNKVFVRFNKHFVLYRSCLSLNIISSIFGSDVFSISQYSRSPLAVIKAGPLSWGRCSTFLPSILCYKYFTLPSDDLTTVFVLSGK